MSALFIWIQELPALRVMAFHALGDDAKEDAFQHMKDWLLQHQLPGDYLPRIFGYDKKHPRTGTPDFGYEVLVSLPEEGEFTPEIGLRVVEADAYACVTSDRLDWEFVRGNIARGPYYVWYDGAWVPTESYGGFPNRQWMEEYHPDPEVIGSFMRTGLTPLDYERYTIMVPIARRY
jgi:hypothetical protein